jgi:hypothetical protein
MTAVFRNSEFATTLFQVHRCIPIYLAAIPIPPKTHILFYIPFLFLVYTIITFPMAAVTPELEAASQMPYMACAMLAAFSLPFPTEPCPACCPLLSTCFLEVNIVCRRVARTSRRLMITRRTKTATIYHVVCLSHQEAPMVAFYWQSTS